MFPRPTQEKARRRRRGSKGLNTEGKYVYPVVNYYTYLGVYGDDLHKRVGLGEFERQFKRPHQTVKAHLQGFVDARILTLEKRGRFSAYSLNLKNPLLREYLTMCEKERLLSFLGRRPEFKRLYETLSPHFRASRLLVFGSAATTEDYRDIDLLVISKDRAIRTAIDHFAKTYQIDIHVVQTDEAHLTHSFIAELRKSHVILNQHDYFIEVMYAHEPGLV